MQFCFRNKVRGFALLTIAAAALTTNVFIVNTQSEHDDFAELERWIASNGAGAAHSPEALAEGMAIARRRRDAMRSLILAAPDEALRRALAVDVVERLPAEMRSLVEKRVEFRGDVGLRVYDSGAGGRARGPLPPDELVVTRRDDGAVYRASTSSHAARPSGSRDIPLSGIELDGAIALDPMTADAADAASASEMSAWTEGPKSVLVIRVDFSDRPGEPVDYEGLPLTSARALATFSSDIAPFFAANSYGKTTLLAPAVTSVVRVPQTQTYYLSNINALLADARAAARAAGFETANYSFDLVAFSYDARISWNGAGTVGGKGFLLNGDFDAGTIAHELGHNYGLLHANLWRTTDGSVIGAGVNQEYGDGFDMMGRGSAYLTSHFNARYKRVLGWLTDGEVINATAADGVYRIYAQDSTALGGTLKRLLRIPKNATRTYWIEFRQLVTGNPNAMNGAVIRWDYPIGSNYQAQLLDMTPSTLGNTYDAPLLVGQTFYDQQDQIRITIVGKGGTSPESLDVRVELPTSTTPAPPAPFDLDGDRRTDIAVFRSPGASGQAEWWGLRSSGGTATGTAFGASNDVPVPADFTGDGRADLAVFRPSSGQWLILRSEDSSFYGFAFGRSGDVAAPADYDGDAKADPAVFRAGTWFISSSTGGTRIENFGSANDRPVPADHDGDGRADLAISRPTGASGQTEFWIARSSGGVTALAFGLATDSVTVGDWTGDAKADAAFWRPSTGEWFILRSEDRSYFAFPFGSQGDVPAPGDYDGDGKLDAAVFRPASGTWYINRSTGGTQIVQFGAAGDRPVPNSFVR
ncbi:MAG: hypothetical protein ACK4S4_01230 [Pyrinomonadaceae bacterium]